MINFSELNALILVSGATQLSIPANLLYWMETDDEKKSEAETKAA